MEIKEYQEKAKETAVYPEFARGLYPTLGLAGEVGEVCNKIKKLFRDNRIKKISVHTIPAKSMDAIEDEIGDVLWYLAAYCTDRDYNLVEVFIKAEMSTDFRLTDILRGLFYDASALFSFQGYTEEMKKDKFDEELLIGFVEYLKTLLYIFNMNIEKVAEKNIKKLAKRKEEKKIEGAGDNR